VINRLLTQKTHWGKHLISELLKKPESPHWRSHRHFSNILADCGEFSAVCLQFAIFRSAFYPQYRKFGTCFPTSLSLFNPNANPNSDLWPWPSKRDLLWRHRRILRHTTGRSFYLDVTVHHWEGASKTSVHDNIQSVNSCTEQNQTAHRRYRSQAVYSVLNFRPLGGHSSITIAVSL